MALYIKRIVAGRNRGLILVALILIFIALFSFWGFWKVYSLYIFEKNQMFVDYCPKSQIMAYMQIGKDGNRSMHVQENCIGKRSNRRSMKRWDISKDSREFHFCPDGNQIAYIRCDVDRRGNWIEKMDWRTGEITKLTREDRKRDGLCWSPNGIWIAYIGANPETGDSNVFMVESDGGPERQLTEDGFKKFRLPLIWSLNSDKIFTVAMIETEERRIYDWIIVDLQNGENRQILQDAPFVSEAAWSSDGDRLAVVVAGNSSKEEVVIIKDVCGEILSRGQVGMGDSIATGIRWSPEDDWLLYVMVNKNKSLLCRREVATGMEEILDKSVGSSLIVGTWTRWWTHWEGRRLDVVGSKGWEYPHSLERRSFSRESYRWE